MSYRSLVLAVAALASMNVTIPTGAPESTKLAIFFFIHSSHSPILFFLSSALVLAIIFRISPMSILYNTKNFFMRFLLC